LVVRMATENRDWGYTRIQGALANLDHHVARGTIANILKQHGIEPAPERQRRTTWQEFLKTHWDVLAAADFFTVKVWTCSELTRFAVLFVIELATRRVQITGVMSEPDSAWVLHCGRQVTDAVDGFLIGKHFLLHDRDPLFGDAFRESWRPPAFRRSACHPGSPNLNAFAERFVRTIKESCLDRVILMGEASLRRGIREFVAHYHGERNHQGLQNQLITRPVAHSRDGPIACRDRLGGLLKVLPPAGRVTLPE
jgi:transposase InsO family protein